MKVSRLGRTAPLLLSLMGSEVRGQEDSAVSSSLDSSEMISPGMLPEVFPLPIQISKGINTLIISTLQSADSTQNSGHLTVPLSSLGPDTLLHIYPGHVLHVTLDSNQPTSLFLMENPPLVPPDSSNHTKPFDENALKPCNVSTSPAEISVSCSTQHGFVGSSLAFSVFPLNAPPKIPRFWQRLKDEREGNFHEVGKTQLARIPQSQVKPDHYTLVYGDANYSAISVLKLGGSTFYGTNLSTLLAGRWEGTDALAEGKKVCVKALVFPGIGNYSGFTGGVGFDPRVFPRDLTLSIEVSLPRDFAEVVMWTPVDAQNSREYFRPHSPDGLMPVKPTIRKTEEGLTVRVAVNNRGDSLATMELCLLE